MTRQRGFFIYFILFCFLGGRGKAKGEEDVCLGGKEKKG